MEIKSFVVTISEFFLMDRQEEPNFDLTRKKYVIPKENISGLKKRCTL